MPEKFPDNLFEMLYRRTATEQDKIRLLAVKAALGLSDRDEFWPVILTLDHYTRTNQVARLEIVAAMDALPGKVKAVITATEQSLESKVDQATARAVEKGAERLAQITHRFQTAADRFSKRQFIVAASIGSFVALLCLGAGGVGGYLVTTRLLDTCTSEVFRTAEQRSGCYVD